MYNGLYGPAGDLRDLPFSRLVSEKDASYTRLRALCSFSGSAAYLEDLIALEVDTFKALKDEVINRENGATQLEMFFDDEAQGEDQSDGENDNWISYEPPDPADDENPDIVKW